MGSVLLLFVDILSYVYRHSVCISYYLVFDQTLTKMPWCVSHTQIFTCTLNYLNICSWVILAFIVGNFVYGAVEDLKIFAG